LQEVNGAKPSAY